MGHVESVGADRMDTRAIHLDVGKRAVGGCRGGLVLFMGRAGSVYGSNRDHRVCRAFSRHAPAADPPIFQDVSRGGICFSLAWGAGRDGRANGHDPPA